MNSDSKPVKVDSRKQKADQAPDQKHGLLSLLFNVVLPVMILHRLTTIIGPMPTLVLALAFPLGFGIYDFMTKKKLNPISALGFINVLVTGTLAVLGLGGLWFSVKEAFFPALVGMFVLVSAFSQSPFCKTLFLNPQLMDTELIESRLDSETKRSDFNQHLKLSTLFLSLSFFVSGVVNFFLSLRIFTPLATSLSDLERSSQLNQQIATMTKWSFAVLTVPSLMSMVLLLWYLIHGIKKLTGLTTDEIMREGPGKAAPESGSKE